MSEASQMDIGIITLVQGTLADGTPHYAYVAIPTERYPEFKQAEAAGSFDVMEYGQVLAHGEGEAPPKDVQRRMVEEYNVDHQFDTKLQALMRQWASGNLSE